MIYFHGGGFQCGSGVSSFYGPEFLLDRDVILVIGNYRVGPLGFLSTETLDCPGNFGLKDQVEILRWVQANIAAFGGDPESVTIFGNSAGGASVTYHMLSNSSKGNVNLNYFCVHFTQMLSCLFSRSLPQSHYTIRHILQPVGATTIQGYFSEARTPSRKISRL